MTSIESKLEELKAKKKRARLSTHDFGETFSYGTVFNNMNSIFANVLNESQNGASTSLYHMLLETCGPNDSFITNWKLLKLHGSTNWLVPYLGVDFQRLDYFAIVPKSDRVFLYWQSSLPYLTHNGRWRGG